MLTHLRLIKQFGKIILNTIFYATILSILTMAIISFSCLMLSIPLSPLPLLAAMILVTSAFELGKMMADILLKRLFQKKPGSENTSTVTVFDESDELITDSTLKIQTAFTPKESPTSQVLINDDKLNANLTRAEANTKRTLEARGYHVTFIPKPNTVTHEADAIENKENATILAFTV